MELKGDKNDQILIKIDGSPYYFVQPPLYDWNHPDTQAHIEHIRGMFDKVNSGMFDKVNTNKVTTTGPKLLEPWKCRLASEYNKKYNDDNNIDSFAYLFEESYEDSEVNDESS